VTRLRLFLCLLTFALLPSAAAEPVVRGSFEPAEVAVTVPRGGSASVPFQWRVQFENTTCSPSVEVGVDLFIDEEPAWLRASVFDPATATARPPETTGEALLRLRLFPESPPGATVQFVGTMAINAVGGGCSPSPERRVQPTAVTVHVAPENTTTAPPTGAETTGAARTPAAAAPAALAAALAAALGKRGFHAKGSP
jgi:hypothetical protein